LAITEVLDLSENPEYVYFHNTKQDRAFNNTFHGRLHFALKKLYFQLGGGHVNVKQRLATELYINVRRKEFLLTGLAFWQISKGSAIALQHRSSKYEYRA